MPMSRGCGRLTVPLANTNQEDTQMELYAILRRDGWRSGDEQAAALPVDEIIKIADTVVARLDPEPSAAAAA
jgi:hypothetical protein